MKRIWVLLIFFLGCWSSPVFAEPVTFTVDMQPAGILLSPDLDGIKFTRTSGYRVKTERIEGIGNWAPTLRTGIGFDAKAAYIDVTAGISGLFSGAFSGYLARGEVAARFKAGDVITVGPHVGIVYIDVNYRGDADVDLSTETGFLVGMGLTAGKKVFFSADIDYLGIPALNVKTKNGWVASDNKLNMSGFMVKLGVGFRI